MAWTFTLANVGSSARSWIRSRVGDTSSGNQLIQDEQIDAYIASEGNQWAAGILTAESIAGSLAINTDKKVGKLSIAKGGASDHFYAVADRLRNEMGHRAGVYAGGVSVADMRADEADTDRVDPAFSVGQFDNPGTESTGERDW